MPIMGARFDKAKAMGCDAIEPDNVDGYDTTAHESTGFPLTYEDQIAYNLSIAKLAHDRGMAVGLKNDINQAQDARFYNGSSGFDFVVAEQCAQYNECTYFNKFLTVALKPVFDAEYKTLTTTYCARTKGVGISVIKKKPTLNTAWATCP